MVVALDRDVVRKGVLIGSTTKLGKGSSEILVGRNFNQSLVLPVAITRVVGIFKWCLLIQ